jgi:uncharacterized membrane protein (DUF373 family)
MEPPRDPLSTSEPPVDEATPRRGSGSQAASERRSLAARLEDRLDASDRWLHLLQDVILVGVAALMLLMGVLVLVGGAMELIGTINFRLEEGGTVLLQVEGGRAVVEVAENALLALILAELVGTLLLALRGKALTIEPFLVIAIVAVVRHLLFVTVRATDNPVAQTAELLGVGALVLLLVAAVVLLRWVPVRRS